MVQPVKAAETWCHLSAVDATQNDEYDAGGIENPIYDVHFPDDVLDGFHNLRFL